MNDTGSPGKLVFGLLLSTASGFAGWVQSLSVGGTATGIGLICAAGAGGLVTLSAGWDKRNANRAEADIKIREAAAAASLRIKEAAAAAALKIQREAEQAKLALEIEREAKLGPSLTRQLKEAKDAAVQSAKQVEAMRTENRQLTDKLLQAINASTDRTVRHTEANRVQLEAVNAELTRVGLPIEQQKATIDKTAKRVKNIEHIVTGSSDDIDATDEFGTLRELGS